MKNTFHNILLAIGSLIFTFIVAEIASRFILSSPQIVEVKHNVVKPINAELNKVEQSDGEIGVVFDWGEGFGSRMKPNLEATINNHRLSKKTIIIKTNSLGLRHEELGEKQNDEYRILVLGDSITIGDYLNYDELYTTVLGKKLQEKAKNKVVVINAGIPGASTFDEFYHYLEIKDQVKPDVVLLAMYLNDVQNSEKIYLKTLKSPYSNSRLLSWIYKLLQQNLKFYFKEEMIPEGIEKNWAEIFRAGRNLKSGDMFGSKDGFDFEIYNASMDFGLAWNEKTWEILKNIIKPFKAIVDSEGSELKMFILPIHLQVFGTYPNYYPQEQFMELCKNFAIDCFDARESLAEAGKKYGRKMYYDHCHFAPEANEALGLALSKWLSKF